MINCLPCARNCAERIFISISLSLRKEVTSGPISQLSHSPILLPQAGSSSAPCSPCLGVPLHRVGVPPLGGLAEGVKGDEVTGLEPQLVFWPHCPALHNGWFPCHANGEMQLPRGKAPRPRSHSQQGLDLNSGLWGIKPLQWESFLPALPLHPSAHTSIPALTPRVPAVGVCRGSDSWGQPPPEVERPLHPPRGLHSIQTARRSTLREEPAARGRQVPAEPPPLQTQLNPLKGMLHELCNLASMGGFSP